MPVILNADAVTILHAVLGLGALTFVMFLWMAATRLPAMQRMGLGPQEGAHTAQLRAKLPSEVLRVSDNYNHLFEAPTVFYAVALAVVLLGRADGLQAHCAVAYVGLRIIHSLVQATVNIVLIRFTLFGLSWAALATMIVHGLLAG